MTPASRRRGQCAAFVLAAWLACSASLPAADPGLEFFEKKIRPVLVAHCYECHSREADKTKGGLLLDSRAGVLRGGESGPAAVPGKPAESLLIEAIRYESFEMPPTGRLPEAVVADFVKWVEMGAPDPRGDDPPLADKTEIDFEAARQFWAFQPPRKHAAPEIREESWPAGDVDRFILARLEAAGLRPAADADRATWLRRVTFDLTGLPPAPGEIAAFLGDESERAYETVVDRLLGSPHFGEHWARHWLDLARYADSNGGDINLTYPNAWRYRDYVVNAFNTDKPFDQFVVEQLAGDLLPAETDALRAERLIATGFLVVGPKMLSERNKEKLHMDVVDEQLDTIGKTFLGLTLGCARCHDHKFDPVPTHDYYALAGILRSTITVEGIRMNNVNVSGWIERPLPIPPDQARALAAHKQELDDVGRQIAAIKTELDKLQKQTKLTRDALLGVVVDDSHATVVGEWKPSTYVPRYVGTGYVHDNKEKKGGKSITFTPELPKAGEYEVRLSYAGGNGRDRRVPVTIRHAQGEASVELDQVAMPQIGGLFQPLGRFRFDAGRQGSVTISTTGTTEYVIADAAQFIPVELLENEDVAAMDAALKTQAGLSQKSEELKRLEQRAAELKKKAPPAAPTAMAAQDREQPADTAIRVRGEPHNLAEVVPRGFLTVTRTGSEPDINPQQSGRLEMGRWIASPDNPLTARVIVNRIWHHLFGAGLVRTVDNFGQLGERPSHPELLDTLAVDFVEHGWSVKHLVRQLVLSRTYRQATSAEPAPCESKLVDPENRLLWRMNRRRLNAECIRDALLAASGALDRRAGGSAVEGYSEQAVANNPADKSGGSGAGGQFRRSLYLPLIRNDLPDFLTIFDFADPDVATGSRAVTTVPAQALLMLNSEFVRSQARRIAEQALAAQVADDDAQLDGIYLKMLGRPASDAERSRARDYLAAFQPVEAADGVSPVPADVQAWSSLCHVIAASTEFRFLD